MRRGWVLVLMLITVLGAQAQELRVLPDDQRLLVWAQPIDGSAGQLLLLGGEDPVTVLALAGSVTSVAPCGTQATSSDGRHVAFSVTDGRTINLYQMTDTNPRLNILSNNINAMTCVGTGVEYDPSGQRIGYLTWPSPGDSAISLVARLLIHQADGVALVGNFENVADFEMTSEGASFVTLFRNSQNEYVEAGINLWDGTSTREITTLVADQRNGCYYTSASIAKINTTNVAVTVGVRCRRGVTDTQYQIYNVDVETRIAALLLQGRAKAQFLPYAQTNQAIVSPNEGSVFQLLPDNLRVDTGVLIETSLTTPAERILVPGAIQMPQVNRTPNNSNPIISPDGAWLALVVNDANNNATLYAYDMNTPTVPPITVPSSSRGDRFSGLMFTQDSSMLLYLAGTPQVNAAFAMNLTTGVSNRIARGQFNLNAVAVSPFTLTAALVDSRTLTDAQPRYDTIVMVDLMTGAQTDILVGAQISAGRVRERLALVPIAWRLSPSTE